MAGGAVSSLFVGHDDNPGCELSNYLVSVTWLQATNNKCQTMSPWIFAATSYMLNVAVTVAEGICPLEFSRPTYSKRPLSPAQARERPRLHDVLMWVACLSGSIYIWCPCSYCADVLLVNNGHVAPESTAMQPFGSSNGILVANLRRGISVGVLHTVYMLD